MHNFFGFCACTLLMSYALYAEHFLGLEPCPMCIFQRISTILLGLTFLLGCFPFNSRFSRLLIGSLILITSFWNTSCLATCMVAESSARKGTWVWPWTRFYGREFCPFIEVFEMVFSGSGECANIDWSFIGLSMPAWVIVSLSVLLVYGAWSNLRSLNQNH